jgi:hypothetical protein
MELLMVASTTAVDSWSGLDLLSVGPIYPFVGSEALLWIVGLVFWIGFHILGARIEKRELEADAEAARHPDRLSRVFTNEGEK